MNKFKNFQLNTPSGKKFDCLNHKGSSGLLLIFYKGAWCGFCKKQLLEISRNYFQLEKLGIKAVAISTDSQINTSLLSTLVGRKPMLLSDPGGKVSSLYLSGGENEKVKPSIFIFDSEGGCAFKWQARIDDERIEFSEIIKQIEEFSG